jgi:hypothetical protein
MNDHERLTVAAHLTAALIGKLELEDGSGRPARWATNLFAEVYRILPANPGVDISPPLPPT